MTDFLQPVPGGPIPHRAGLAPEARGSSREEERSLLAALRRGDEAAFSRIVERYHASMVRVARLYVESAAVAEEVAQEAWLGVLQGLDGFQGTSTLKAWIFAIVANCARTRGARERRTVPFSSLAREEEGDPSVDPERFLGDRHTRWPGHWSQPPEPWAEDALESRETIEAIASAMEAVPPMQRAVMTMRDVEGLGADETCQLLGISEGNQRVLLHRARSKVRKLLEDYLQARETS